MPFDEEELDPHGECAAEIARLRDQCADTQMLAHRWMETHDHLLGWIQKEHPELLASIPQIELPAPADLPNEIRRLRGALVLISGRTEDANPPYRVMSIDAMARIARDALAKH